MFYTSLWFVGSALFLNDPYFPSGLSGAKAKDMAAL